jgi:hypothetical protein
MDGALFLLEVRKIVAERFNDRFNLHMPDTRKTKDSVFIVWSCKTLQNNKALAGVYGDNGMYYEVTYNGDKKEYYIDEYVKISNTKREE